MKSVLLIGVNRFGSLLAKQFHDLGHQVMAVDRSEDRINRILPLVTDAQIGDSTSEAFLRSLGVGSYDVCIVTIGSDFQSSLETTSLLKELGGKLVVSRADRDVQTKFLLRNGADHVIYPEHEMAEWTAIRFSADDILDYIELPGDNSIFEYAVPAAWVGKSILEIDVRKNFRVIIIGIVRNGILNVDVDPKTVLEKDDSIMVTGKDENIEACFRTLNERSR